MNRIPRAVTTILACCLLTAACSSGESGNENSATDSTTSLGNTSVCVPTDRTTELKVAPVSGSSQDFDVTSFDGTVIRAHWFPYPEATPDNPYPTVLMGPGWSMAGATDMDAPSVMGSVDIRSFRDAGYNVLTWDPRGFGESSGSAMVDSVDYEARDVQYLIDWISTMPQVRLDGERDPRMGMAGGSYGGGIQLVTAAIDCRVDAIVPIVAWHSLGTSLYKTGIIKSGWANTLALAVTNKSVDEHVTSAAESARTTGVLSSEDEKWFLDRGPDELVERVKIPTLFIQGTVDTLFTLDEAVTNFKILRRNGVPTAMLWHCDGHGVCLSDPGDTTRVPAATVKWLDRYVKGDKSVDTGVVFDTIDQNGNAFQFEDFPETDIDPVVAAGKGQLELTASSVSGPVSIPAGSPGALAPVVQSFTPARASTATNVRVSSSDRNVLIVGAPLLKLTYTGKAGTGDHPQRVFAQLVDDETGLVIGNQITPVMVKLDGKEHTTRVPLEMISFSLASGSSATLQIVATTVAYAEPQLGGSIDFSDISLRLPVAKELAD